MIAAELAAHFPRRIDKLVLISPIGLWNDAYPVTDVFAVPATDMPPLLYRTPPPSTNGAQQDVERIVTLVRGMTTVALHVAHPDRACPDGSIVRASTLVIHGENDFVPGPVRPRLRRRDLYLPDDDRPRGAHAAQRGPRRRYRRDP
jgi:pimeloyl-ACP methyl ester carboxylesterase